MTQKSKTKKGESVRTALFPGSFNPFTIGHESIVRRVLDMGLADKVIIAVGINMNKSDIREATDETFERSLAIQAIFANEPRVGVTMYQKLTGRFALSSGASFIVRGIRSVKDYEYEIQMADANREMFGIETVFIPALPEQAWISSSTVRELKIYGEDVSELLP